MFLMGLWGPVGPPLARAVPFQRPPLPRTAASDWKDGQPLREQLKTTRAPLKSPSDGEPMILDSPNPEEPLFHYVSLRICSLL